MKEADKKGRKVLLVSPNRENNPAVFPLGLGYMRSALLAEEFEAPILDFMHVDFTEEVLHRYLGEFQPDFICISIRNLDNCCFAHPRSYILPVKSVVDWIRRYNSTIPVILGGSGFSILPGEWMSRVKADYGIAGDGGVSLPLLLTRLVRREAPGRIPGLVRYDDGEWEVVPVSPVKDLENLLPPSRDGFLHPPGENLVVRHNIQTKRGCNLDCSYCVYPELEGKKIRIRQAGKVIDEIRELKERYGICEFDFVDNVFNNPLRQAVEICKKIIVNMLGVQWSCFLNPLFCTGEFINLLVEAGCRHVELGIDSGSDKILRALNKKFTKSRIGLVDSYLKKARLSYNYSLILGSPGETIETVKETFRFLEELGAEQVFGLIGIRILPGTRIYKRYASHVKLQDLLEPRFYMEDQLEVGEILDYFNLYYKDKYPGWTII